MWYNKVQMKTQEQAVVALTTKLQANRKRIWAAWRLCTLGLLLTAWLLISGALWFDTQALNDWKQAIAWINIVFGSSLTLIQSCFWMHLVVLLLKIQRVQKLINQGVIIIQSEPRPKQED